MSGRVNVDYFYNVEENNIITKGEIHELYEAGDEEFKKVSNNLLCPYCKTGEIDVVVRRNLLYFETKHNTHKDTCPYRARVLKPRISELIFKGNRQANIKKLVEVYRNMETRFPIKGDFNRKELREIIAIKPLEYKINEDDYDVFTIFYGKMRLVEYSDTLHIHHFTFENDVQKIYVSVQKIKFESIARVPNESAIGQEYMMAFISKIHHIKRTNQNHAPIGNKDEIFFRPV